MGPFVIAIDGLSGAGKGTLARRLGAFYDFAVLDTGLLYRAVGSKMRALGQALSSEAHAVQAAQNLSQKDLDRPENRLETSAEAASCVASFPRVRDVLSAYQKDFAKGPPGGKQGAILDGRDIGTHICPEAPIKLYLVAQDEIRAKRRFEELKSYGITRIYADVLDDIRARDERDKGRKASPLRPAEGAVILDTSSLTAEAVFLKVRDIIESSPAFEAWQSAQ